MSQKVSPTSYPSLPGPSKTKIVLVIIYISVFLGLTSLAVLDVIKIIQDYANENRVVSVKQLNITGHFPFIKPSSSICILSEGHKFGWFPFKESERIIPDQVYSELLIRNWRGQDTLDYSGNYSEDFLTTFESISRLVLVHYIVRNLDHYGPNFTQFYDFHLNKREMIEILNRFLNDSNITNTIDETFETFSHLKPRLVQDWAGSKNITVSSVTLQQICFRIPLTENLAVQNAFDYYEVHFFETGLQLDSHDHSLDNLPPPFLTGVTISPQDILTIPADYAYRTHAVIKIVNHGLYEVSKFASDCDSRYPTQDRCLEMAERRAIQKVCNCTQFTEVMAMRNEVSSSVGDEGPPRRLCTIEIYEGCWDRAKRAAEEARIESLEKGTCVPCQTPKNTHMLDTRYIPYENNSLNARVSLLFECHERMYLLFEERAQFTFSQLVSQIGGDLGLYIGFSMMSVLQGIVFIYHAYHQSTAIQRRPSMAAEMGENGLTWTEMMGKLFGFFFQYIVRSVNDERAELIKLKKKTQTMERGMQEMMREMDEMKKRLKEREEHF